MPQVREASALAVDARGDPPGSGVTASLSLAAGTAGAYDTDSYIRAIDVPCPARLQLSDAVSRKIARARDYRKGEPWPFTMSGLLLTSLGKVFEKVAVHSAHCKAATVSVALEEYRRRQNGHLPESLQLLAPTWIGQIPAVATATFVGEYMQGY